MSHLIREKVTKEVGCPMRIERNEVEQYWNTRMVLWCSLWNGKGKHTR